MKLKVAAVQMDCVFGDWQKNMDTAKLFVDQAFAQGAKLIVLPELFSTGHRLDEFYYDYSEYIPEGKTTKELAAWAKEKNIFIVGCIPEKGEVRGAVYDTAFLVGPNGFYGKYRKINPWWQEKLYFQPGDNFVVWETEIGKLGSLICYDGGFPEIGRKLALKGADILVMPSAYGKARLYAWEIFTRARALENGCYLIAANRSGQEKNSEFAGNSRIVNPRGEVISQIEDGEGVIISEIDLDEIARQRRVIPYQQDLRQDLFYYGKGD